MSVPSRPFAFAVALACAAASAASIAAPVSSGDPATVGQALVRRVLPAHAASFVCTTIPAEEGRDVFEYEGLPDGRIALRGNNGVSVAVAFNQYLRREARLNFGWQATGPLTLAGSLPRPTAKVHGACAARERFFLNYCTFGYTTPWWTWDEWQRFVDWMAMNGINRPLLQCGQEAVWLRVWQGYGMSPDEIRAYFSGPAHLPWHRMANLDRWGGPLATSYIDGQQQLQVQILQRVRELGMKAILSGFAGHVPPQIAKSHPQAKITRIGKGWGGMAEEFATMYLDPTDPLFAEIQQKFIREQTALYGTDHLYAADPFNEMVPPSLEPEYLASVSRSIFAGMEAADPEARWYEMAWTFFYQKKIWNVGGRLAASLRAVPTGRLVMLDYVCEEEEFYRITDNFYGQPFIWNYLGNFGGNIHLVAPVHKVSERITQALRVPNCAGIGSTLEGINVNPVIYDLVLEQPWRPGAAVNLDRWIDAYATQRAQGTDQAVIDAWRLLAKDVLIDKTRASGRHISIFQARPPEKGPGPDVRIEKQTRIDYPHEGLVRAVNRLFDANASSRQADGYRFDAVNLTRQCLVNRGLELYADILAAYAKHDVAQFAKLTAEFLETGRDLDRLLGTRTEFLLGRWLTQARRWGQDAAEADWYEHNAREIITSWHVPGANLEDYANRQYEGLVRDYYLPRWEKFFALCAGALEKNAPFPEKEFADWANAASTRWTNAHNPYATAPTADPVATAEQIFRKNFGSPAAPSR